MRENVLEVAYDYLAVIFIQSLLPQLPELKAHYQRGGLGHSVAKKHLHEELEAFLAPIHARRHEYASDPAKVMRIPKRWSKHTYATAQATLDGVRVDYASATGVVFSHAEINDSCARFLALGAVTPEPLGCPPPRSLRTQR